MEWRRGKILGMIVDDILAVYSETMEMSESGLYSSDDESESDETSITETSVSASLIGWSRSGLDC